jgi:hypothetical protein
MRRLIDELTALAILLILFLAAVIASVHGTPQGDALWLAWQDFIRALGAGLWDSVRMW